MVIQDHSTYDSVKNIPCFITGCGHAYHRPLSSVVERSDRSLTLNSKYKDYLIRTCKKHHEIWKKFDKTAWNTCEICRGLNNIRNGSTGNVYERSTRTSTNGTQFNICVLCATRQSYILKLTPTDNNNTEQNS